MRIKNFGELRTAIHEGINNYGEQFLLGFIDFDEDTYIEIKKRARGIINDYYNKELINIHDYHIEVVSFALVAYGIKERDLNNFWSGFAHAIETNKNQISDFSRSCFKDFCNKNSLFFYEGESNNAFVSTIKTHALVTNERAYNLFENLYQIYRYDLMESYQEENVEFILDYAQLLFQGDNNLEKEEKRLLAHFKTFPKHFLRAYKKSPILLGEILKTIFFNLNQYYYGDNAFKFKNDRFDNYFKKYIINSKDEEKYSRVFKRRSKTSSDRVVKFRKIEFKLERQQLSIYIPSQLIKGEYFVEEQESYEALIRFYSKGNFIFSKQLDLIKGNLFYKTAEVTFELNNFYPNLTYKIYFNDCCINERKTDLCGNYLIFNSDNINILEKNIASSIIRIISKSDLIIESDNTEIDVNLYNDYKISTLFLNENSYFIIDDKLIHPSNADLNSNILVERYNNVKFLDSQNIQYEIYKNTPNIFLRIDKSIDINSLVLVCNGFLNPLAQIARINNYLICDETNDNLLVIKFQEGFFIENEAFKIIIREKGGKKNLISSNFVIINILDYVFDKKYYYGDKETSLISLESSFPDIDSIELPISLKIEENQFLSIPLNENYQFLVKVPLIYWSFGKYDQNSKIVDSIFYEDIKDEIFNSNFNKTMILIFKENGKIIDSFDYSASLIKEKLDFYKFENKLNFLEILLKVNNSILYLFTVNYKPSIKNISVDYNLSNNETKVEDLFISWDLIGNCKLLINLVWDGEYREIIKSLETEENKLDLKQTDMHVGYYIIEFYSVENNFFGESELKLINSENIRLGNSLIINSKRYCLRGAEAICCDGTFKKFNNVYLKNLKKIDSNLYNGDCYFYINGHFVYCRNFNPVILNLEKEDKKFISFYIRDYKNNPININKNRKEYEIDKMHFRVYKNER